MIRCVPAFLAAAVLCAAADRYSFEAKRPGEAVAELVLRSPGADWAVAGREAAVASVRLDGTAAQSVILYGGEVATTYTIFLGPVRPGHHEITIEHDGKQSAKSAELVVDRITFRQVEEGSADYVAIANAPVLFARANTVGRFSDVPLMVYCERTPKGFQYTVIFSNEDGGTSTRALMARWGRTTDIEYVYDLAVGSPGAPGKAIVQGPGHKDIEYRGSYFGLHPILMPVTDNNMVEAVSGAPSPLRFQIAPVIVDLSAASRESVMDRYPVTWTVAAKELEREGKFRPFGTVDGEKISDNRNYLNVDYRATLTRAALNVDVALKNGMIFSSSLGRPDYAIGRTGSVRTTVELPPGTSRKDIASLTFSCLVGLNGRELAHHGECRLEEIHRVFLPGADGRPGADMMKSVRVDRSFPSGQSIQIRP